jgi:hypothetical protein
MVVFIALTLPGFAYAAIFVDNFPYSAPRFIVSLLCAVGVGSLVSLLAFVGLGMVYRLKLDLRREECRQLVAKLLESRLGNPSAALRPERAGRDASPGPVQDGKKVNGSPVSNRNLNPDPWVQAPARGNGSPAGFESAAQG